MKTRLVNAVLYAGIFAGLVLMVVLVLRGLPRFGSAPKISPTPVILQQVQTLSQLVTVKYVTEKVVILNDIQPYRSIIIPSMGANRVLLVAHGIVKAGIDLGEIKDGDIETSNKKISIKLPPARVTDAYLDDKLTTVVEHETGMLRRYDKDLEQNARQQAVLDIHRAAREWGILKDAEEKAKAQLTIFFRQLGYEEVEFRSR